MSNTESKEQQIKKILSETDSYVIGPYEYIYDLFDYNIDELDMVKCLNLVIKHNNQVTASLIAQNEEMESLIKSSEKEEELMSDAVPTPPDIQQIFEEEKYDNIQEKSQSKEVVDKLIHINHHDFYDYFKSNPYIKDYFPALKLAILRSIKELKNKILTIIADNPLNDLSAVQAELTNYNGLLDTISLIEMEEEEVQNDFISTNDSNIIIIPNSKNSSYILDDIKSYPERFKDIQNSLNKILTGTLKDTKNIKQLGSVNQKLYEYWNKTGLRILFMKMDNNKIALSLLFYKDKQKSTKIAAYYSEAVKRYEAQKDNLNTDDIDFRIEQLQLIGEINETITKEETHHLKGGY